MIQGLLQLLIRLLTQHQVSLVAVVLAAAMALVSAADLQVDADLRSCPPSLIHRQLQVTYRCQSEKFVDAVTCGKVKKVIDCPRRRYIAVHSAALGRSQYSTECSRMDKTDDTGCPVRCVVREAQAICLGKHRCTLNANDVRFGQACPLDAGEQPKPAMFRIRYICVRKAVLKELKRDNSTSRMTDNKDYQCPEEGHDVLPPNNRRRGQVTSLPSSSSSSSSSVRATPSSSSAAAQESKQTNRWNAIKTRDGYASTPSVTYVEPVTVETITSSVLATDASDDVLEDSVSTEAPRGNSSNSTSAVLHFFSEWLWTWQFMTDNIEKSVLYLLCSLCFGIILLLVVVTLHLACSTGNFRSTKRDGGNAARLADSVDSVKWRSPESESSTGDDRTLQGDDDQEAAAPGVRHHHHHHHPRQGHSWHRRVNSPSLQPAAVSPGSPSPIDLSVVDGVGNTYAGTDDAALMNHRIVSDGEILPLQKPHGTQSLPRKTAPHLWYNQDASDGSPVVSSQTLQPTRHYYR